MKTNIEQVNKEFEELQATTERLAKRAVALKDMESLRILDRVWHRLEQGPVRLLVLGLTSAGKSTLINAMAGDVVVPEGNTATSPLPVWLKHGSINLDLFNRANSFFPEREPMGLFAFITQFCYSALENDAAHYANYSAAECCRESIHSALKGVTIIDTPGLRASSGDDARAQEAAELGCEMVLLMCAAENGTGALSDMDGKYYRALFDDIGLNVHDDLFVVGNVRDETYGGLGAESGFEKVARLHFGKYTRLFRFDVRAARLMQAGAYRYQDLLPDQVKNDEERDNAGVRQATEMALYKAAHGGDSGLWWAPEPQDFQDAVQQLDKLCEAIRCRAMEAYSDPQKLTQPVRDQLKQVAERLLQQDMNDQSLTCSEVPIKQLSLFSDRLHQDQAAHAGRFAAFAKSAKFFCGEGAASILKPLKNSDTIYRVFGGDNTSQADEAMVAGMLSDGWDALHLQYTKGYAAYTKAKLDSLFCVGSAAHTLHSDLLDQLDQMAADLAEYSQAYDVLSVEGKDAAAFSKALDAAREEMNKLRVTAEYNFSTARQATQEAFDVPAFDEFITQELATRRPNLVKRRFGSRFFLYPSVAGETHTFYEKQAVHAVGMLNTSYFAIMATTLAAKPLHSALAQVEEHIAQLSAAIHKQLICAHYSQLIGEPVSLS